MTATLSRCHFRVRSGLRSVKFAYQRVVRGWDDSATWNLDDHLTKTLGAQLVHMGKTTHSYPGEEYPYDEWTADLQKHGQGLLTYAKHWDDDPENWEEYLAGASEALRWVADHLPSLWD